MSNHNRIQPLTKLPLQLVARISHILDGHAVWQQLNEIGIHQDDRVEVIRKAPFGGPIHVRCNGRDVALGKRLAEKILVTDEMDERET
jgi:Fe2+ transport system protein FeoA